MPAGRPVVLPIAASAYSAQLLQADGAFCGAKLHNVNG